MAKDAGTVAELTPPGRESFHLTRRLALDGTRWWLTEELEHAWPEWHSFNGATAVRSGQAAVVKEGPHRTVYRIETPESSLFLKHHRIPDWTTWFRQWLRPVKARSEFERALELSRRGVNTVVPLGWGLASSGESFVVTRALEDVLPLHLFLTQSYPHFSSSKRSTFRQELAQRLGAFVARLHSAGVRHHDFHAGNILIQEDEQGGFELFLIDLDAVQLGRPLSGPACRKNLAMLNGWFQDHSNRADRLRFWKAYVQARRLMCWPKSTPKPRQHFALARRVEEATWDYNLAFWEDRDCRCLQSNRYFRRVRAPGIVGHAVADLPADLIRTLTTDPDEPFRRAESTVLKDSPSSTVIDLGFNFGGETRSFIYKRFNVAPVRGSVSSLFRTPAALRCWILGHGFLDRSLPTARPLIVLHRRRMGLLAEGYLLMEKIEQAKPLQEFAESLAELGSAPQRSRLRHEINRLARLLRRMHQCRLSHRDLKADNILTGPVAKERAAVGFAPVLPPGLWLIDLVGVRTFSPLPRKRQMLDLARLNVSFHYSPQVTRTDRLRFLREYLHWGLLGKRDWKTWWRVIEAASLRKIAKNRRSGRPLT